MVRELRIQAGDSCHLIVISDELQALLAAQAAGRAVLGVEVNSDRPLKGIPYVVTDWSQVTEELAGRVLLRKLGLPWEIGFTNRLLLRELCLADSGKIPPEETLSPTEAIFREPSGLRAYLEHQYVFFEYGIWAVIRRRDQTLVGLAGLSPGRLTGGNEAGLELGYRIFRDYRRQGYGLEVCRAVVSYAHRELETAVYALIAPENQASRLLAEKLGLKEMGRERQSPEGLLLYAERFSGQPDRLGIHGR